MGRWLWHIAKNNQRLKRRGVIVSSYYFPISSLLLSLLHFIRHYFIRRIFQNIYLDNIIRIFEQTDTVLAQMP